MNLGSGSSAPPPPHSPAGLANIGKTSTYHTKRGNGGGPYGYDVEGVGGGGVEPMPTTTTKRVLVCLRLFYEGRYSSSSQADRGKK
jgi:hypothetical protein